MSSPAAVRGQEVRGRLLAAAAELIPERGWSAVSTRILADRAGVTPSVVHYHFPSVQAVLTEAAVSAMRQMLAVTDEQFTAAATPAEAIDAMLASIERHSGVDPLSLLFVEAYLASTRDEHLRAQIAALVADLRHRVGDWLAIHQVPDPAATAAVLAAAIDGLLLHRGLGSSGEGTAKILRRLV
ncbi:TetR/AcrR family transcriptional regulator [Kribbella turkmenica]|uniref:TetR/AcrR family transcriptional regulator n=1 Tax=Kribbella turkmenica TaxID=2530375 RepID=A0A4R4X9G0_9ACTN|nr:TetR/AcrR family transcriptional regulator [Kribbella turkmenica]TDD27153.1 TetR/AcrR family transcriptional regulator [Kribbella turkmenica]